MRGGRGSRAPPPESSCVLRKFDLLSKKPHPYSTCTHALQSLDRTCSKGGGICVEAFARSFPAHLMMCAPPPGSWADQIAFRSQREAANCISHQGFSGTAKQIDNQYQNLTTNVSKRSQSACAALGPRNTLRSSVIGCREAITLS